MDEQREVKKRVLQNLLLNFAFAIIELVGGLLANSLALISASIHDFTDSASLLFSYLGIARSEKRPTKNKTFGYQRIAVLTALINALVLFAVTIFIFYRAYQRLLNPEPLSEGLVLVVATLGIVVFGFIGWRIKPFMSDVAVRSTFWFSADNILGSAGMLIGAVIIILTGWTFIDPLISIIFGLIVLWGVWGILKEAANILLEGVPTGIDINQVEAEIKKINRVRNVHDLHIWSLGTRQRALSCHINLGECSVHASQATVLDIKQLIKNKFQITHATIEAECENCPPGKVCIVA